ncbi:helix-turn-helix domain-containing protein [Catenuloplanes atrovinosus]|uniref:Transcriptional regulator with XRE-family HTH domain n=1 Tax=Catenuloplanes atrovinosus TaxID=137266 RepID=A0AAE3YUI5_9ACTN|nr:helix-turn-helix transcriptional regulator [Catenuloplanes atrovinosus]MDR7278897.1 transcriptional regulator with XRE-family HTH domain [Catenuloplanes atrovinosus]
MSDGADGKTSWAEYIRNATKRPGWSAARLAREAGVHRSTIFRWINGAGGSVAVDNVRRIAEALGDHPSVAIRAAGNMLEPEGERDEELELILSAPVDDDMKRRMIQRLDEMRQRDRERRLDDLRYLLDQQRPPSSAAG